MPTYNTTDLIKLLPIGDDQKSALLTSFEQSAGARKIEFTEAIWAAYFQYKDMLIDKHYNQLMQEVASGKEKLESTLYTHAVMLAQEEIADISSGKKAEKEEIEEIRHKLESLIKNPSPPTSA